MYSIFDILRIVKNLHGTTGYMWELPLVLIVNGKLKNLQLRLRFHALDQEEIPHTTKYQPLMNLLSHLGLPHL